MNKFQMKQTRFPSLMQSKVIELLNHRHRNLSLVKISKDTGLTENWLSLFSRNEIPNASAGRIEALYNYLNDTKFEI